MEDIRNKRSAKKILSNVSQWVDGKPNVEEEIQKVISNVC